MSNKKLIEIIRYVLTDSKKAHIPWVKFLQGHPRREKKYEVVGGTTFHKKCIRDYNRALKALHLLEKRRNK